MLHHRLALGQLSPNEVLTHCGKPVKDKTDEFGSRFFTYRSDPEYVKGIQEVIDKEARLAGVKPEIAGNTTRLEFHSLTRNGADFIMSLPDAYDHYLSDDAAVGRIESGLPCLRAAADARLRALQPWLFKFNRR